MAFKKERIFYLDEIRALAIMFVVLIHISKWFPINETPHSLFWNFSSSLAVLGNLGVPLFFMISGALLLNKKYELKSFFKRRFSRIFIPFIFWVAILGSIKIFALGHSSGFYDVLFIIFGEGYVWFVWTLVGLYLFIPVINPYIAEFKTKGAEYYIIIWLITFLFNTLSFTPYNLDLTYFSGFLGYLILGWYLTNKQFKLSDKSMMIIGILMFVISSLVCLYKIQCQLSWGSNFYLTLIPVFQASGVFLFFRYFANIAESGGGSLIQKIYYGIKDSRLGKIIFSISVCSYGIYLTHYMFIWIFKLVDNVFLRNPFKWIPLMFLVVLIGSWGLVLILSKIPYLKKISGT